MFKTTVLVAILFSSLFAEAALQVNCDVWGKNPTDPTLDVAMVLPFTVGQPFDKMPVSPSTLSLIEKKYSGNIVSQTVIFNDDISHLNKLASQGMFETFVKNFFPVVPGGDVLHPKPVPMKVRRLGLNLQMLDVEKSTNQRISLNSLNFAVEQSTPGESTFTGQGNVTYNGKAFRGLTYRCNVSVALSVLEQVLAKKK